MSIQISPETEARLADEARRQGISVETLLEWLLAERLTKVTAGDQSNALDLPVWHLGEVGSLRRRDIYDDVR
jgi:hypothetical protein